MAISRKSAARARQLKVKISNGLSALPFKAMSLSSKYAVDSVRICAGKRNTLIEAALARLGSLIVELKKVENALKSGESVDPLDMYRIIRSWSGSYVALFYALYPDELKNYLKLCDSRGIRHKEGSDNMLIFPALMAQKGVPKNTAAKRLIASLYGKPFGFMHRCGMDAVKIDMFEQSISIKSIPEHVIAYITGFMHMVRERFGSWGDVDFKPVADYESRNEFVGKIVEFSVDGSSCLAPYMEERLDSTKSYPRLVRI